MKEKKKRFSKQEINFYGDPIVTDHPYFMKKPVQTFLDEDAAVNVNNSEMVLNPEEYE